MGGLPCLSLPLFVFFCTKNFQILEVEQLMVQAGSSPSCQPKTEANWKDVECSATSVSVLLGEIARRPMLQR